MKAHSRVMPWLKFAACLVIQIAVLECFAKSIEDEWHAWGYTYLAWPSIWLAQFGFCHTGILLPFTLWIPGLAVIWLCLTPRLRWSFWIRAFGFNVLWMTVFLALGWCALDHCPNPVPHTTPYDGDQHARAVYLARYERGFQVGKMGWDRTYCFAPDVDTTGHYDGIRAGYLCFTRVLGTERKPDVLAYFCVLGTCWYADRLDRACDDLRQLWRHRPWWVGGRGT